MARDLVDPGAEAPHRRRSRALAQDGHEGVVEDVLGVGVAAELGADEAVERALVPGEEPIERRHVAPAEPLEERLVGVHHAAVASGVRARNTPTAATTQPRTMSTSERITLWSDSSSP